MKNLTTLFIALLAITLAGCQPDQKENKDVISLHPDNPNYFLFKGKPTILVTSGEHYGAVMNADFNYEKYLATLKYDGLNYTRIFLGPYAEIGEDFFGIRNNTMNPRPESWLTPWVKDTVSGKYDLENWNTDFFNRLKAFVAKASEHDIVVEVTLFTSYYSDKQWSKSPFNPMNNIQGIDSLSYKQVNTPGNGKLMAIQEAYVRKVVAELNEYGNITFEIQNEPWSDNPHLVEEIAETDTSTHHHSWQKIVEIASMQSLEWQKNIAAIIVNEEEKLPNKHLIAQNISNSRHKVESPDPNISIFNFHYAYPEAALENLDLKKAVGLDETGFMPPNAFYYRAQAWKFMLAGGALYNNLDYSFTVGSEDGTHPIEEGTPGYGGPEYRRQLKFMKEFIESFQFIVMKPDNSLVSVSEGHIADFQVLAEPGRQYAIYIEKPRGAAIHLRIPDGQYRTEWINPDTGILEAGTKMTATGGVLEINCPIGEDYVLKVRP